MTRHKKVKMSVEEHEPRICKETQVHEPQFWGCAPKGNFCLYAIQQTKEKIQGLYLFLLHDHDMLFV